MLMAIDPVVLQPLVDAIHTRLTDLTTATQEANDAWDAAQAAQITAAEKEGVRLGAHTALEDAVTLFIQTWTAAQNVPAPPPQP